MRLLGKLSSPLLRHIYTGMMMWCLKLKGKALSKLAASPNLSVQVGPQVCACDTNGVDKKLQHICAVNLY